MVLVKSHEEGGYIIETEYGFYAWFRFLWVAKFVARRIVRRRNSRKKSVVYWREGEE